MEESMVEEGLVGLTSDGTRDGASCGSGGLGGEGALCRGAASEERARALLRESVSVLSYVGDAAFELFVRRQVVKRGIVHGDRLHMAAVRYVRAAAQAAALKSMFDGLPEDERWLVKRSRNRKISTKPKNADALDYRWATAFEALLGYYCLSGQEGKLEETAARAMRLIDGDGP
ncbi:MAG: Mini-ribonuclease 3 [Clostridiales Family XIII bacterium]|jgi:ribonuclease-3 family protein|nr:Mini-ribonuclease 3 [Clostridiales Family XIII bacterium]